MVDVQWAFISIVTTSLAHFILRIVLGRELGAEGLGVYTLAFTVYLLGMQFAAFGIGSALTQYVAESLENIAAIRTYVSSGMTSSIITGALMGIVLYILAPFIAITIFHVPEMEFLIQLTALCYPFIAIQKAVLGTLNGLRRMHLYAVLTIVQNISTVIISLLLVLLFSKGVQGAVIGFVIPTIIIGLICPIMIREFISLDRSLWNAQALRATTMFGFFVVLGNSIGSLSNQVDSLLIGYFLNPTEVGIYAVAILLSQTLTLVPGAIQRVTAPVTAALYGKGNLFEVRQIFISTLKKSFYISIVSAITIALFGPYIIEILFGEEFLEAYVPMLILLIGYVFGASFSAVGATLSSIGKVRVPYQIGIIAMVINVVLNILLIPILGIIGGAMASCTTMIVSFGITTYVIFRLFRTNDLKGSPRMYNG